MCFVFCIMFCISQKSEWCLMSSAPAAHARTCLAPSHLQKGTQRSSKSLPHTVSSTVAPPLLARSLLHKLLDLGLEVVGRGRVTHLRASLVLGLLLRAPRELATAAPRERAREPVAVCQGASPGKGCLDKVGRELAGILGPRKQHTLVSPAEHRGA